MDFGRFTTAHAERGQVLQITNPETGEPAVDEDGKAITFTVIGSEARAYQRKRNEILERRDPGKKLTIAQLEADSLELTVASVIGWSGNIVINGETFSEFSPANVRMVLAQLPVVRQEVDKFCETRSNFWKVSPGT